MTFRMTPPEHSSKRIQKILEQVIETARRESQDGKVIEETAEKGKEILYRRTKAGKQLTSITGVSIRLRKMKPLSDEYIDRRLIHPPEGEFARARKSNLTYTGQMLEALDYNVQSKSFRVRVRSSIRSDGKNNEQIAEYVQEGDRYFMGYSDGELRTIQRTFRDSIRSRIRQQR